MSRPLTDRQTQIVDLAAQGIGTKEIAAKLYLSPTTVKRHLADIYRRLGARDRAHAVAIVYQRRLDELTVHLRAREAALQAVSDQLAQARAQRDEIAERAIQTLCVRIDELTHERTVTDGR